MFPVAAHDIKINNYVSLSDKTYKVVDIKTSKTGKHGHMKVVLTGIHIFSADKKIYMCPGHQIIQKVEPVKREYQIIYVDPESHEIQLLNSNNENLYFRMTKEDETIKNKIYGKSLSTQDVYVIVTEVPEGQQITDVK